MDSVKIGSLRVEVVKRDVTFTNQAPGIKICYAVITSVVNPSRHDLQLMPGETLCKYFQPGDYKVIVISLDLIMIACKIGAALGVPMGSLPLIYYISGRIGKPARSVSVDDFIACYKIASEVARLQQINTETPDLLPRLLSTATFMIKSLSGSGRFRVQDDDDPELPRTRKQKEELPYRDSYQRSGGVLRR